MYNPSVDYLFNDSRWVIKAQYFKSWKQSGMHETYVREKIGLTDDFGFWVFEWASIDSSVFS